MPDLSASDFTTRYHDEGNHPLTTALLTAVGRTPSAFAMALRPISSANFFAGVMTTLYPHQVDFGKSTFRGLRFNSQFVNYSVMATDPNLPPYVEIGRRLIAIRKAESDLSQKDWALKHGFNVTQYNNWEKGVRRINLDEAERLCELYGLKLDFIYRGNLSGLEDNIKNLL